ncbi:hypothetical protein Adt_13851 [Abeliophyllum distichum]|uniref:Uncharacterized protein n=1 Tax=Abeliophyllum distichum TaxID=126358 RepID=A0ABD1TXZ0_9LAMI
MVKYPLWLKLIELDIEDVSFSMDQTKRYLEVRSTSYENYDFSAKKTSIEIRSWGDCRIIGRIWQDAAVVGSMLWRHFKLAMDYQLAMLGQGPNEGHCSMQLANILVGRDEHKDCVVGHANDPQCF